MLACGLGIFTEWRFAPFNVDDSFSFFVAHLHDLTRTALISMAVGGFFGYWFGRGRPGGAWLRRKGGSVALNPPCGGFRATLPPSSFPFSRLAEFAFERLEFRLDFLRTRVVLDACAAALR